MRRVLALLGLVLVCGGALRAVEAADPSAYQSADERSYGMLARWLARHQSYEHPGMQDPAHWVPGAPIMFAITQRVIPNTTKVDDDLPTAPVAQAVVGTAAIGATFLLGLLLAGPWAGLAAATLVAFYPPLLRATGDQLSEPLGALLATGALAAVAWALQRPSWRRLGLSGLLLGATILTRADLALLPAIGVLVLGVAAWREASGDLRRRAEAVARRALPVVAGVLILLAPWSAYASSISGRFVLLSSGGESNLFIGTYLPGDGSIFGMKRALADETRERFPELRDKKWFQLRQRDVIRAVAARHPDLSEAEALSKEARDNLREYALGDPIGFAAMMARKVERLWGGYSLGTHGNPRPWITAYHLLLVALGVAGLLAGLLWARRHVLWLVALPLLYVTALNAVLVSEARHNMTLIPTLAVAGAAGLALALRTWRDRRGVGGPTTPTTPEEAPA